MYGEKVLGDILPTEDGFYQWWPDKNFSGYLSVWFLRAVADILDDLNRDWQSQLDEYMNAHKL